MVVFEFANVQRSSTLFGHLQHFDIQKVKNILHACPSSLNILSGVHASCINAFLISGIIHTQHTEYSQHLHKCLDTNLFNSLTFIMHWYTSLNISIVQGHTPALSLVFILSHQFSIFHPFPLEFSFTLGSIVQHNYSPPPFSE